MESIEMTDTLPDVTTRIWFPFKAVSKGRPRLGRRRRGKKGPRSYAFTPQPTKDFEAAVKDRYLEAGGYYYGGIPVIMEVEIHIDGFWLTISPAVASVRPVKVMGDLDNMSKSISDGLNGIAYDDDRRIEGLHVEFVGIPRKGTEYAGQSFPVSTVQSPPDGDVEPRQPEVEAAPGGLPALGDTPRPETRGEQEEATSDDG